ncbi:MAG TPA: alpha/beta fold hydrolase [Jatrophihabitans sp.]|jgi:pimeloyl-ACP methyl ester carboxylesterase|uniref:alpha/beta fold hydrolase n=1 Tax=Jatrophihabitans sp. TaxID=1932789 RepID=UPI002F10F29D
MRALPTEVSSLNGRPVRVLVAGTVTDLPEVVLVPGLGAPGYLTPWVRQIATWTRATVLDLPGWRWGRARACPATVAGIGAATARWLIEHDRRDVVLLGHSTGAQAVVRTASLVGDRLAGVVLAGPTFDPAARTVAGLLRRAAPTLASERLAEVPAVLPSYLHSGGVNLLRFLLDALRDRPEDRVAQLGAPVLVVTGERDGFAPPAWAHHLAALTAGRCAILPGAHNACFPYPVQADAALREAVLAWTGPAADEGGWASTAT